MWVSRGGYGRVGVTWWVWVSCGSARWVLLLSCGSSVTAWVAARFQALTSHFGSFTHGVGSGKVSRLSLSFFFFEKPLTLSVLPQPQVFHLEESFHLGFLFFLSFFRLDFGDWSLLLGCWVFIFYFYFYFFLKINLLIFIYLFIFYKWASWLGYNFRGA